MEEQGAHRSMASGAQDPGTPGSPGDAALSCMATGEGQRVVLVHGFTQTAASWRHVAALLERDFEVVAVDLPGHGGSGDVRVAGLEEAADLLGATAGRASYVGYSLGGRLCLTLALRRPELVERLVLVGATAGIKDATERAARRQADEGLAARLDPAPGGGDALGVAEFLQQWLQGPLFAHLSAEQADLGSRLANRGAGLAASLRSVGTGTQHPSWDRLATLAMPVLLVTGERDPRFGALAEAMAAATGDNAEHVVVAGAGHAVPFEAPAPFAALVATAMRGSTGT